MQKYDRYISELLRYNNTHRLSGAKTEDEVKAHIKDSLEVLKFVDFSDIKRVVDIGTGAGFPGLVLAIELRDIEFFLVEPLSKRVAFLHLIKSIYELDNVTIVNDRVENIEIEDVDLITSRAVTKTDELLTLSSHLIDKKTQLLLFKGSNLQNELKEIKDEYMYDIIQRENRNYLYIKGRR